MPNDLNHFIYVNEALGYGTRPEGALPHEESNRLKLARAAVIRLQKAGEVIGREPLSHPVIEKNIQDRQALTYAQVGVDEFLASRQQNSEAPAPIDELLERREAFDNSAEGRRMDAQSKISALLPKKDEVDLEDLLSA